jgi:ribose-phosphate pyrophosphokinase
VHPVTIFAETPAPVRRLFQRLDFAPKPTQELLRHLLEYWTERRGNAVFPRLQDVEAEAAGADGKPSFVYRFRAGERDYSLVFGAVVLEPLLGPTNPGSSLSEAPNQRVAVRLRRLFETVQQAGEPVLAEFLLETAAEDTVVEIVAAPLSEDGRAVDAILGGLSVRPIARQPGRWRSAGKHTTGPLLFALGDSADFGKRVADHLGVDLAPHEEREFEDGEHKARPLLSVRNRDVYVIDSLTGDARHSANDKLCRLLFFIGALRDSGAGRVTAVVPYLCYARKDRQTKARDPITTRYVAQLFEAVGTERVLTMEAHNLAAFQNAFRCDTEHLDANALFIRHFAPRIGTAPVAVVSPDLGGGKRAELLREELEQVLGRPVARGFMDKQRSMGKVTGDLFAGDVDGRFVIVVDDLISTGTTMARVAAACRARGATRIWLAATHGLFAGGASVLWREPAIDEVVVTDTVSSIPLDDAEVRNRLVVLETAELFAKAIARCHGVVE